MQLAKRKKNGSKFTFSFVIRVFNRSIKMLDCVTFFTQPSTSSKLYAWTYSSRQCVAFMHEMHFNHFEYFIHIDCLIKEYEKGNNNNNRHLFVCWKVLHFADKRPPSIDTHTPIQFYVWNIIESVRGRGTAYICVYTHNFDSGTTIAGVIVEWTVLKTETGMEYGE